MALKSFKEMNKIDISKYTKERDGAEYLPWTVCKKLLHDNGAEIVYFEPILNSNGSSLFMTDVEFKDKSEVINRCYEVRIKIVIDDLTFEYNMPVMNGNLPVRDNSMSQLRVNNAQARAFVKGVAIRTGLGFSLWLRDDSDFDDESETEDLSKHNIMKVKERFEQIITRLMAKQMSLEDICRELKIEVDAFKIYMQHFLILDRLEKALLKI